MFMHHFSIYLQKTLFTENIINSTAYFIFVQLVQARKIKRRKLELDGSKIILTAEHGITNIDVRNYEAYISYK